MNTTTHERSIYLVVDPSLGLDSCLDKVQQAIEGGIHYLQLWNHWLPKQDKHLFSDKICETASKRNIPVFINEEWEMLALSPLSGVHFDNTPPNIERIRAIVNRPFTIGLTCGRDLSRVKWAVENKIDYISFCSIFPSSSAGDCEIVPFETIKEARKLTNMPIFASGGITLTNIETLLQIDIDGIAVISGIMNAKDVEQTTKMYKQKIQIIQ